MKGRIIMCFRKKKTKAAKNAAAQNTVSAPVKSTDDLTGVLSLPAFYKEAADFIRYNSGTSFAFCRASVGNIRAINESYGMVSGDKVLKAAADVIGSDNDIKAIVARDRSKFVFMVPYETEEELKAWTASIHEKLGDIGNVLERKPKVYMHMGVYATGGRLVDMTVEEMVACAKVAESEASKRTHASVVYYSEQIKRAAQEDIILVRDMKEALEKKQFAIALQPKFSPEGEVVGAKVMTRWMHPELGAVGAWRFVPLFVKNGFILDFDLYLLEEICALEKKWKKAGKKCAKISVNMPRALIADEKSMKKCAELKKSYGVDDGLIGLEFTERLIEDNAAKMPKVIEFFRNNGFMIILDAFGGGSGKAETITEFRPDTVKFSPSIFEKGSITDEESAQLDTWIKTAKDNGILTAVTGVPEPLLPALREKGVDIFQGDASGAPMSVADFESKCL